MISPQVVVASRRELQLCIEGFAGTVRDNSAIRATPRETAVDLASFVVAPFGGSTGATVTVTLSPDTLWFELGVAGFVEVYCGETLTILLNEIRIWVSAIVRRGVRETVYYRNSKIVGSDLRLVDEEGRTFSARHRTALMGKWLARRKEVFDYLPYAQRPTDDVSLGRI